MASDPYQPSSKRIDCFISFHGSGKLADLGFPWAGEKDDMRGLAIDVYHRLGRFGARFPSVFYDNTVNAGCIPGKLAQALLELCGGGVGLVLLTPEYLRRDYCLAELRAFLELRKESGGLGWRGKAIEVIIVRLGETDFESIREAFNEPEISKYLNGLNPLDLSINSVAHGVARCDVVKEICDCVHRYWGGHKSLCLGKDRRISLGYLQNFFTSNQVSVVASALEVRDHKGTLESVFDGALDMGALNDFNLDELSRITTLDGGKEAVSSFKQKWNVEWCWSNGSGENGVGFRSLLAKARSAVRTERDAASSVRIERSVTSRSQPSASRAHRPRQDDCFKSYFPSEQSTLDLAEDAAIRLAALRTAILPSHSSDRPSAGDDSSNQQFAGEVRRVVLVSVVGEGGVGKTSTCKLLCADEGVRKHFSGGALLWIDVGHGATEEKVKGEIRGAMRKCGGKDEAKEICTDTSVDEAVGSQCLPLHLHWCSDFFSEHRILVVIDNVWEIPASSSSVSWAATLWKIARYPGSVVIMTTRSSTLSECSGFHPIRLGRLDLATDNSSDWRIAEQLYDRLLQASPEEQSSADYKKYRRKGLELSCGLFLGIVTFTGLVRNRMQIGGNVQSLLEKLNEKVLGLAERSVGKELKARIGHHGLFAAMEEGLAHLDEHKRYSVISAPLAELKDGEGKDVRQFRAGYDRHVGKPLSSRYAALEVMPESSTRLSFPILYRLWHVATVGAAEEIAQSFVNIGLGCIERGRDGQEKELVLHDLQYEFCASINKGSAVSVAGDGGGIPWSVNGHAILLSSCESLVSSGVTPGGLGSDWSAFCFQGLPALDQCELRRHVAQNLFRHLFAAAAQENYSALQTMLGALTQFQWIRGRISAHGRNAILSDCSYALKLLEKTKFSAGARSSDTSVSNLQFISSLQICLMRAVEDVSMKSDGSLAASLCQLAQSFAGSEGAFAGEARIANRLAMSVERHVRGPWLSPVSGCPHAFPSDQGTIAVAIVGDRSGAQCVAVLGNAKHVISGSKDGVVWVHESMYLETELELAGHSQAVRCVAVAMKEVGEKTVRVFSGSDDSFVRFWDVRVDLKGVVRKVGSGIVGNCEKKSVRSLSVTSSGARVVGCDNRNIFIFKAGAERMSSYKLLARIASPWYSLSATAISRSGKLVVAGDSSRNVGVWNEQDTREDRFWVKYGYSAKFGRVLRAVSVSCDEKSLLCVLSDGEVKIQNFTSGRIHTIPLPYNSVVNAICSYNEYDEAGGSESSWRVTVCGEDTNYNHVAVEYCLGERIFEVSRYRMPSSSSRSICLTPFAGSRKLVVGHDDDICIVEANGVAGSDGDEVQGENQPRDEVSRPPSPNYSYGEVHCVAVLPVSGRVIAGHEFGNFSLWRMEGGKFERGIKAVRRTSVTCVDVSDNERVAVSGHWDGLALVWDATTWNCLFSLESSSDLIVCAAISADNSRIVTVDGRGKMRSWDGSLRFWDGILRLWCPGNRAPLTSVESGSVFGWRDGTRGAISRDGKYFLWATESWGVWKAKLIDLVAESVICAFDEEEYNWCTVLENVNQRAGGAEAEEKVQWRFGAVVRNRLVDLPAEPRRPQGSWEVVTGWHPREVSCGLRSAGESASPRVDMIFDISVESIAAGWMQTRVCG